MKKLFKKESLIATAVNLGIGGAANAAMDYAVANVDALKSLEGSTINWIKVGVGVLGGTMFANKFARAGFDGLAVVGVSDLIKGYVATPTNGVPFMGTGKIRVGQQGFRQAGTGKGNMGQVPFMS